MTIILDKVQKEKAKSVKRLENVWNGCSVRQTEVEWVKCRELNNEKMVKRRMRKWAWKRGGERMMQQQGWRRNREGEMDREGWLCVILWTPFIYTWNKRPGLACKPLSWWGLKWNWHFQFVPWHVCLGLFTHSSASPSLTNLVFHPTPLPLIIPSLYLFTNLLPHQSQSDFLSTTSIPQNAHSQTRKYWADSFIAYTKHVHRKTCAHCTINIHSAHGTVSKRRMPANASKTDRVVYTGNKKW